jgi:YHS domain-containing protein
MFRLVLRFLLLLVFFAVIRSVVTTVARLFAQAFRPPAAPPPRQTVNTETGGELKQDPVCGTFVLTRSSVKKTVNGELIHFCSAACRDKFKVA